MSRDREDKRLIGTIKPFPYYDQTYTIWLPKTIHLEGNQDSTALGQTTLDDYRKFGNLVHATHMNTCAGICKDRSISPRPITDFTLANPRVTNYRLSKSKEFCAYTVLMRSDVVWLASSCSEAELDANDESICSVNSTDCPVCNASKRFGPVCFFSPIWGTEGIVRDDEYNYYWLEVIDYNSAESASRILVTRKTYPELEYLRFDPTKRGGPWFYDIESNRHYTLKNSMAHPNSKGKRIRNHTTEFLKEGDVPLHKIRLVLISSHNSCRRYKDHCLEASDSVGLFAALRFVFCMRNSLNAIGFNVHFAQGCCLKQLRQWIHTPSDRSDLDDLHWESFMAMIMTGQHSTDLLEKCVKETNTDYLLNKLEPFVKKLGGGTWKMLKSHDYPLVFE